MSVEIVKSKYEEQLKRIKGVIGVGTGNRHIVVFVKEMTPEVQAFVPTDLEGIPVRIMVTGKVELLSATSKVRPVPAGVSIGHYLITAGTLGCWVTKGSEVFGLSNNHVVALNWGDMKEGNKGDKILQPGSRDGGTEEDAIGELDEWVDVDVDKENKIDAGLFRPYEGVVKNDILEVGKITDIAEPQLGSVVKKFGRTTGLTYGKVEAVDASIEVEGFGTCPFTDQIIIQQPFVLGGDSGSLLVDEANRAVGLVFAASDKVAIANRITNVVDAFNVAWFLYTLDYKKLAEIALVGGSALVAMKLIW